MNSTKSIFELSFYGKGCVTFGFCPRAEFGKVLFSHIIQDNSRYFISSTVHYSLFHDCYSQVNAWTDAAFYFSSTNTLLHLNWQILFLVLYQLLSGSL